MSQIKRKNLWLDANQGETENGKAFGFIGVHGVEDYCGWFFDWPSAAAKITTVAERVGVIDSLASDETSSQHPAIPYRWARQKLEKYLRATFDLRRKS